MGCSFKNQTPNKLCLHPTIAILCCVETSYVCTYNAHCCNHSLRQKLYDTFKLRMAEPQVVSSFSGISSMGRLPSIFQKSTSHPPIGFEHPGSALRQCHTKPRMCSAAQSMGVWILVWVGTKTPKFSLKRQNHSGKEKTTALCYSERKSLPRISLACF